MPLSARVKYRWLESLPGMMVWATLLIAFGLAFLRPIWVIGFIVLFDVYWLIRIIYIMSFVVMAYLRFRKTVGINWQTKLETVPNRPDLYHIIFIPVAGETANILLSTVDSIARSSYPLNRLLVVIAPEQRTGGRKSAAVQAVVAKYPQTFYELLVVEHPDGLAGEVAGKGANVAYAGRQVKKFIDHQSIPVDDILVTTLDADSQVHAQYFSYLSYVFLNQADRWHMSYQPIPLFTNNAWSALPLMRVVANSTTFWLMSETMRPNRLLTFSSHSMPWKALLDVDFWQTDVVSDDSRIFIQCLIRYDGHYGVVPLYLPIMMDTVEARGWRRSLINQYKQIRRWAYGVENLPFMIWNFAANKNMPRWTKFRYLLYQVEGTYSWAIAPVLITVLGWLPFQTNQENLNSSVIAQNAPGVLRVLMIAAMVGALISAVINALMIPPRPNTVRRIQWLGMLLQWLLMPLSMLFYGAIPAIESQTRLMLGKYLGFWVTAKERKSSSH